MSIESIHWHVNRTLWCFFKIFLCTQSITTFCPAWGKSKETCTTSKETRTMSKETCLSLFLNPSHCDVLSHVECVQRKHDVCQKRLKWDVKYLKREGNISKVHTMSLYLCTQRQSDVCQKRLSSHVKHMWHVRHRVTHVKRDSLHMWNVSDDLFTCETCQFTPHLIYRSQTRLSSHVKRVRWSLCLSFYTQPYVSLSNCLFLYTHSPMSLSLIVSLSTHSPMSLSLIVSLSIHSPVCLSLMASLSIHTALCLSLELSLFLYTALCLSL